MLVIQILLVSCMAAPLALVAIAILLERRERRVLLAAVRALPCPACRSELSALSIQLADELWQRHFAALVEQNPDQKFRIVRGLDAVCQTCGARLRFDQKARTLAAITMVLAFEEPVPEKAEEQ